MSEQMKNTLIAKIVFGLFHGMPNEDFGPIRLAKRPLVMLDADDGRIEREAAVAEMLELRRDR